MAAQDTTAAVAATNVLAPRIQFAETNFNFGTVQPTDVLKHEFILTNTGNAVLQITAVQPGCGCTTAGQWDREVPPGKTGRIPLQFNPAHFKGPVTKVATVTCNDPVQATHLLHLAATIVHPLEVQPAFVSFMAIEGDATNETKVVRITNSLEDFVSLEPPVSTNAAFKAELKTVRPGKEFELAVTCVNSAANAYGTITINTSSTNTPKLMVSASAMQQPAILVMPQLVRVQANSNHAAQTYAITVRNISRTEVKLSDAAVNFEGATAEIHEIQPGKNFTVRLTLPANFQVQPGKETMLTLKTTHPKYPVLKVPLVQMPQAAPTAGAVKTSSTE